jgi:steroid delta-isomerase
MEQVLHRSSGSTGRIMSTEVERALERYLSLWDGITADQVGQLREHASDDMRFRDPFNDVRGLDACLAVFEHMFTQLDEVRFEVKEHSVGESVGYAYWSMTFVVRRMPGRRPWRIEGMSRIAFDPTNRVVDHEDFWDATPVFEALPVVGWLVKAAKKVMG